ncbi:MAG: rod shape-determining protein, partial [Desulfovibrio sp.]|nr:rod shape-determining protein [Desulfovibrio sp.]
GTANTLLYTKKHGIVLNEPTVVALESTTGKVLAVGAEAKKYQGRTPNNLHTVRPLKEGVIADFDITTKLIEYFVRKVLGTVRFLKPRFVICVPMGITMVEKKAVIDSALLGGAREVRLIEEPMAAAIGAGLNVHAPTGHFVLDIGGGTSECAVVALDGIVVSKSIRVAGDVLDLTVQRYIRDVFRMEVGITTAEKVKISLGQACAEDDDATLEIAGKDVVQGVPRIIVLRAGDLREALGDTIRLIADIVLETLELTPPELSADILEQGLFLAGGGSLLNGMDRLLAKETGLFVHMDVDPLLTVIKGTGCAMQDIKEYKHVFIN